MNKQRTEIYIGGKPPRDGNIKTWQENIIQDPMPIAYKMLPLSDLFKRVPSLKVDATKAADSFLSALDLYCK